MTGPLSSPSRPLSQGGRLSPDVRLITERDIEEVLVLWGSNAGEHVPLLSYDRWGPGVAVPARPEVTEVEAFTRDPLDGTRDLLRAALTDELSFCLVADTGHELAGFLTGEIHTQSVNDFRIGSIRELYVRPEDRRRGIGSALVEGAIAEFRRRRARMFRAEVNPDWKDGMAFWRTRGAWLQDAVVFNHYE
ncbi:GNAT family N-acetyltransferase [Nonomuraea sp. SYSU D8015]|uniref:GNAT family N-acetyltransferase n=1 Tax=Nonomuraea sp. SYSU D8015 TaxID=2593644 RepID=UPI0016611370|nr:GNAT family N-acetyltransferase [Nonomuraea sp. SYSU D8015]